MNSVYVLIFGYRWRLELHIDLIEIKNYSSIAGVYPRVIINVFSAAPRD
jgi:hypothetical protein